MCHDTGAWVGSGLCAVVGASPKGLLCALGAHSSEGIKLLCFSCHGTARARDTGAWVGSRLCAVVGASPKDCCVRLARTAARAQSRFVSLLLSCTQPVSFPGILFPSFACVRRRLGERPSQTPFGTRCFCSSLADHGLPRRRPSSIAPRLPPPRRFRHLIDSAIPVVLACLPEPPILLRDTLSRPHPFRQTRAPCPSR